MSNQLDDIGYFRAARRMISHSLYNVLLNSGKESVLSFCENCIRLENRSCLTVSRVVCRNVVWSGGGQGCWRFFLTNLTQPYFLGPWFVLRCKIAFCLIFWKCCGMKTWDSERANRKRICPRYFKWFSWLCGEISNHHLRTQVKRHLFTQCFDSEFFFHFIHPSTMAETHTVQYIMLPLGGTTPLCFCD